MAHLISHIYLLILFYITVVQPLYPISEYPRLVPYWYEWLLLAWITGVLISEITNPADRSGLGWIRIITLVICSAAFLVHLLAIIQRLADTELSLYLYIRNQFLAFSMLLSYVQLLEFFSFHHLFGPWGVIIHDLIKDLIKFLVILFLSVIGFAFHLSAVQQPVFKNTRTNQISRNSNAGNIFGLLFFSLFGMADRENFPLMETTPDWAPIIVDVIFGVYLMVTLIVLINLLIAMMSDTYQRIQSQSDTEWKFGRAKLIRNMNKQSASPPPLNLCTMLATYTWAFYKHRCKYNQQTSQFPMYRSTNFSISLVEIVVYIPGVTA